jgi:hypothetical protein
MNTALQLGIILVGFVIGAGLVIRWPRRADDTRAPSNQERMLRWADRYAPPWQVDERKQQMIRQWRRDAALDQRAARLARVKEAA